MKKSEESKFETKKEQSKRAWNSGIQDRVLIALRDEEFTSVTALATALDVHRASASRAINALKKGDFVGKDGKSWLLTAKGQSEVEQIEERATRRVRQASESVRKAFAPLVESASSERRKIPDMDRISSRFATSSGPKFKLPEDEGLKMKQQMMSIEKMQEVIGIARGLQGSLDSYRKIMEPDRRMLASSSAKMAQWAAESNQAASRAAQIVSQQTARDKEMRAHQKAALARVQSMMEQSNGTLKWYREEAGRQGKMAQDNLARSGLTALATSAYRDAEFARLQAFTRVQGQTTQIFLESHKAVLQTLTADTARYDARQASREIVKAKELMWEGMETRARVFDRLINVSTSLSGIVGDMREMRSIAASAALSQSAVAQMRGLESMAASYRGYITDVVTQVPHWSDLGERERAIYNPDFPTEATENLVIATRQSIIAIPIEEDEERESEKHENQGLTLGLISQYRSSQQPLEEILVRVSPRLAVMWVGAWETLDGNSPDRFRQAAHSVREVLAQMLHTLAPDEAFTAEERRNGPDKRPSRKMRFKKALGVNGSKGGAELMENLCRTIDSTYDTLSGIAHTHEENLGAPFVLPLMLSAQGVLYYMATVLLAKES